MYHWFQAVIFNYILRREKTSIKTHHSEYASCCWGSWQILPAAATVPASPTHLRVDGWSSSSTASTWRYVLTDDWSTVEMQSTQKERNDCLRLSVTCLAGLALRTYVHSWPRLRIAPTQSVCRQTVGLFQRWFSCTIVPTLVWQYFWLTVLKLHAYLYFAMCRQSLLLLVNLYIHSVVH